MSKYQIENDVPIPTRHAGMVDALRALEVGQSVVLPMASTSLIYYVSKATGRQFVSRKVGDGSRRVWRVR